MSGIKPRFLGRPTRSVALYLRRHLAPQFAGYAVSRQAVYLQLPNISEQDCLSIGKLRSSIWHLAFMVNLQKEEEIIESSKVYVYMYLQSFLF